MNQKIVVAISIIAIVLSLVNLTILFLSKSNTLSFSSAPQNLYAALALVNTDSTTGYSLFNLSVINPTNDQHFYSISLLQIGTNVTSHGYASNLYFPSTQQQVPNPALEYEINAHETQTYPLSNWGRPAIWYQKVEVSIVDEMRGVVYDKTLELPQN